MISHSYNGVFGRCPSPRGRLAKGTPQQEMGALASSRNRHFELENQRTIRPRNNLKSARSAGSNPGAGNSSERVVVTKTWLSVARKKS